MKCDSRQPVVLRCQREEERIDPTRRVVIAHRHSAIVEWGHTPSDGPNDATFRPVPTWRKEPPTEAEIADPRIIGWILRNNDDLDIIVRRDAELWLTGDVHPMGLDKFPLLLAHIQISTEWCPIYAPDEP